MVIALASKAFTKVFGSRNERLIKAYTTRVEQINALEADVRGLTDAQLRAKTQEFRDRVAQGEKMTDMMAEVLAVAREAMDRAVGIRNIFNPEHQFDPGKLPDTVRGLTIKSPNKLLRPSPLKNWVVTTRCPVGSRWRFLTPCMKRCAICTPRAARRFAPGRLMCS